MPTRAPTVAPPVTPNGRNLVTAARTPDDPLRWLSGVAYVAEAGVGGGGYDPCEAVALTDLESGELVEWDTFGIYVGETCSVFSEDVAARARRRLLAQTPHLVEDVFSTLVLQDGSDFTDDHPNVPLYDPTATQPSADPIGIVPAFALMEQTLAEQIGSVQGMIHVPPALAPYLNFYGLVIETARGLRTPLTNQIVVIGTGYSGASPDQVVASDVWWIYGTSIVEVRLGEMDVTGDDAPSFVRATNDIEVRATREVLAHWDLSAHIGIPVCVPDPGPETTCTSGS